MSVRDIQAHLEEIYGVEVGPDLISKVTDAVLEEQRAWQSRALEPVYLIVYIDALFTKIRDKSVVPNRAIYTVMGIARDGKKDILGFWSQGTEGAKFWLSIFAELRQRGLQDILILEQRPATPERGLAGNLPLEEHWKAAPQRIVLTLVQERRHSRALPARGRSRVRAFAN